MKLFLGVLLCSLVLGVSSQGWLSFLKEAGQGKAQSMGVRWRLHLASLQDSPVRRHHPHRAKAPSGKGRSVVFKVTVSKGCFFFLIELCHVTSYIFKVDVTLI